MLRAREHVAGPRPRDRFVIMRRSVITADVVVVAVLLLTLVPVIISARLTGGGGITRGSAAGSGSPGA
jgi:hypothetical protein